MKSLRRLDVVPKSLLPFRQFQVLLDAYGDAPRDRLSKWILDGMVSTGSHTKHFLATSAPTADRLHIQLAALIPKTALSSLMLRITAAANTICRPSD